MLRGFVAENARAATAAGGGEDHRAISSAACLQEACEAAALTRQLALESSFSHVHTSDLASVEEALRDLASQPDFPACAPKTTALLQHRTAAAFFDCSTISFLDGAMVSVLWLGQLQNMLKRDHDSLAGSLATAGAAVGCCGVLVLCIISCGGAAASGSILDRRQRKKLQCQFLRLKCSAIVAAAAICFDAIAAAPAIAKRGDSRRPLSSFCVQQVSHLRLLPHTTRRPLLHRRKNIKRWALSIRESTTREQDTNQQRRLSSNRLVRDILCALSER